jgi:hypothetical protein
LATGFFVYLALPASPNWQTLAKSPSFHHKSRGIPFVSAFIHQVSLGKPGISRDPLGEQIVSPLTVVG